VYLQDDSQSSQTDHQGEIEGNMPSISQKKILITNIYINDRSPWVFVNGNRSLLTKGIDS